jgi:hypothetical protein
MECGKEIISVSKSTENKKLEDYRAFLSLLEQKLVGKGFEIKRDIQVSPYKADLMALTNFFESLPLGKNTRVITLAYLENTDIGTTESFSMSSTRYALDNHKSLLSRSLVGALLSFPVIVSDDFNIDTKLWMEKTSMGKHFGAFEFPVLISLKDKKIYYCKKTPFYGWALYKGFRKFVEENFSF